MTPDEVKHYAEMGAVALVFGDDDPMSAAVRHLCDEIESMRSDAELGKMVRKMPRRSQLMHRDPPSDFVSSAVHKEWEVHIIKFEYRMLYEGDTPDVALKAAQL